MINEEKLFEVLGLIQVSIGEIKANQINHLQYIEAVSKNVIKLRDDFVSHTVDDDAHGGRSRGRVWDNIWKVIASICTVIAIAIALLKYWRSYP